MAGRIELITGPMFAGKTIELHERMERRRVAGDAVPITIVPAILINPGQFELARLKSHDGRERVVRPVKDLQQAFERIHTDWPNEQITVGIDEVQFFPPEVVPVIERAAREWGWTVICAGLNFDFKKDTWEIIEELFNIANKTIECWAECAVCGDPKAAYTQRLHLDGTPARADEPRVVLSGDSVRYEPRCWRCHVVADAGK